MHGPSGIIYKAFFAVEPGFHLVVNVVNISSRPMPQCYGREIQDPLFFYKALYGYVDLDISKYVSF